MCVFTLHAHISAAATSEGGHTHPVLLHPCVLEGLVGRQAPRGGEGQQAPDQVLVVE
jgi:hypothetical protein